MGFPARKALVLLVIVQIGIIVCLGLRIIKNDKTISYLNKKDLNVKGESSLKYFYDLKPNLTEVVQPPWLPEKATYTINSDALNERYNYPTSKADDVFRIMTLGDSFTYGQYVDTKDNWTELLENMLNNNFNCGKYKRIDVINLGVPGYDVQYAVERYRIRGEKYNPDLIMWMLTDSKRVLEKIQPLIDQCEAKSKDKNAENRLYTCWITQENLLLKQLGEKGMQNTIVDNFNKIFDLYQNKIVAIDLDKSHEDILKMIDHKERVYVFDLPFKNPDFMLPDKHPNKKGHESIAKSVYDYLIGNNIIPCH